MSDQENTFRADDSTVVSGDVEGHRAVLGQPADEDVEGHRALAGVQSDDDDVEGHRMASMQPPRGDDDVEGHRAF